MLQHADFPSLRSCHFTACLFHSITSHCNSVLLPFIWLLSVQFPECLQSVMLSAPRLWASLRGKLGHYLKLMGQTREVEMTQCRVQMLAITSGSHRLIKESSHCCHWWTVMTDIRLIGFICWSSSWNFEQRVEKTFILLIYFVHKQDVLWVSQRDTRTYIYTHIYIYTYNIFCTRFISKLTHERSFYFCDSFSAQTSFIQIWSLQVSLLVL